MLQLAQLVVIGLMPMFTGVGVHNEPVEPVRDTYQDTAVEVQDAMRNVKGKTDWHAVFPEDIPMGDEWDATNPTKRKEGTYNPGKIEDGVWHWEFVPKENKESTKVDLDVEAIQDYIDAELEKTINNSL